eukprot:GHVU01097511.1.p1 GENE.GHVU01097511.1~~GHVU01097511.1.p1  ORF type:complete len:280 (-),score=46.15 GHVU01097511.1:1990-2829(-)
MHEELKHHPSLSVSVSAFVARHFLELLTTPLCRKQLVTVEKPQLIQMIREVCQDCRSEKDAGLTIRFCSDWAQLPSSCDLIKECKTWVWNEDLPPRSTFKTLDGAAKHTTEWNVSGIPQALAQDRPITRVVSGLGFDWKVRVDAGPDDKLRIVYDGATKVDQSRSNVLKRFPAAYFTWQASFKGTSVISEKPVFICFPEGVSLHWSTTMSSLNTSELCDTDELTISVNLMEIPLVSLVLYYFSRDLNGSASNEDIVNRLPHIEYRCLSSYSIFHKENTP